jgi:hypothetical protein
LNAASSVHLGGVSVAYFTLLYYLYPLRNICCLSCNANIGTEIAWSEKAHKALPTGFFIPTNKAQQGRVIQKGINFKQD